jgi:TetR/AcrR family transcriptional regulator, mexJK operon transcriptional repressor
MTMLPPPMIEHTDDLERDLRELARSHLSAVLQPRVLQLRGWSLPSRAGFLSLRVRIMSAFRSASSLPSRQVWSTWRSEVYCEWRIRSSRASFCLLALATPLDKAMFWGDSMKLTAADIDRFAATGVPVFLSAYRAG